MANEYIKGQLAAGEILLVDTRQHWIAAIRYAIKPILIAGLAVLLGALNQWLRFERLGFINDIVHWIIVIALIVAIVWLPIDLFRWWSRHYVLTNRRAMRMEGVLRKQSFDSSLEQINDILLSQSLLGRQLGYADLTLLTANSSNEAYRQLLDGPQFKKAVLEAKEAIRSGHPLLTLPEGFVVKGGTNEASLGASRKSADEAAAAGAAATATVVTTAAATMGFEEEQQQREGATMTPSAADDVPEWPEPIETGAAAAAPTWPESIHAAETVVERETASVAEFPVEPEPAPEPVATKTSIVAPDEPATPDVAAAADTTSAGPSGGSDGGSAGSGSTSSGDASVSADGGSTTA